MLAVCFSGFKSSETIKRGGLENSAFSFHIMFATKANKELVTSSYGHTFISKSVAFNSKFEALRILAFLHSSVIILFFIFLFLFFWSLKGPHSTAYGGSQSRGLIRAVATGLCQSHSNQHGIRAASAMPDP